MFKHGVVNYCTLDWQTAIEIASKSYFYNNYKSLLTVEKYLTLDMQLTYRIALSKFRLSNDILNISRYNKVPKENRICNFCQQSNIANVIDCEYHAFLNVLSTILYDKHICLTGIYMEPNFTTCMLFFLPKTLILLKMFPFIFINSANECNL